MREKERGEQEIYLPIHFPNGCSIQGLDLVGTRNSIWTSHIQAAGTQVHRPPSAACPGTLTAPSLSRTAGTATSHPIIPTAPHSVHNLKILTNGPV